MTELPAHPTSPATLYAAVRLGDRDAVERHLEAGANPRLGNGRESPLHAAARTARIDLVERLIVAGALPWQTDDRGRTPLDVARRSRAAGRAAIVALLDRHLIADPAFRAAVAAIHAGDVDGLTRLLDAHPRLLEERIIGPEVYRRAARFDYFRDPKLFWYVANNPITIERMPRNIVEVAHAMIARGVEAADLDYTLVLAMSGSAAREQGLQVPLARMLLDAGAVMSKETVDVAAAHGELDVLRTLVAEGSAPDAAIAAALGDLNALATSLPTATTADVQRAFALAVINGRHAAVTATLDRGADVNAFLPVHTHATALHQAANDDDPRMIELLLARGARPDVRDALWDGTPLDWAVHEGKPKARAALENLRPTRANQDEP